MASGRVAARALAALWLACNACWNFEVLCDAERNCPGGWSCDAHGKCVAGLAAASDTTLAPSLASGADPPASSETAGGAPDRDSPGVGLACEAGSCAAATPVANAGQQNRAPAASPPATPPRGERDTGVGAEPLPDCGVRNAPCCGGSRCGQGLYCDSATGRCQPCAGFRSLGFAPGQTDSHALGISADGSLAVGYGRAQRSANQATLWQLDAGPVTRVPWLPTVDRGRLIELPSAASAASANGRQVVGYGEISVSEPDNQERRVEVAFQLPVGGEPLQMFAGRALGVSGDASVIVGWRRDPPEAFRWTAASLADLGLVHGLSSSQATGVSLDGCCAVGWGTFADAATRAVLWTHEGQLLDLGTLAGGSWSSASATNADGSVVVGSSNSASGRQAFRWRRAEASLQSLSPLDGANATDARGNLVVGSSAGRAAIWDAESGQSRLLEQELGALLPAGWVLQDATGISGDGRSIVGYGTSPNAPAEEAWLVTLGPSCESQADAGLP